MYHLSWSAEAAETGQIRSLGLLGRFGRKPGSNAEVLRWHDLRLARAVAQAVVRVTLKAAEEMENEAW